MMATICKLISGNETNNYYYNSVARGVTRELSRGQQKYTTVK